MNSRPVQKWLLGFFCGLQQFWNNSGMLSLTFCSLVHVIIWHLVLIRASLPPLSLHPLPPHFFVFFCAHVYDMALKNYNGRSPIMPLSGWLVDCPFSFVCGPPTPK